MPNAIPKYLLACYFDVADINFALVSYDSLEVKFFNFPYTYSDKAFSNQISEADFNKTVIEVVLKSNKIKTSDVDVIAAGLLETPLINLESKLLIKMTSLISEIGGVYPLLVNGYTVLTKDAILSYEACLDKKKKNLDEAECDELANLSIYPQLMPVDIPTIAMQDRSVSEKVGQVNLGYSTGDSITFSGSRFSRNPAIEYLDWILAIDLVRKPGIYELLLDRKNAVLLLSLVKKYKPEFNLDSRPYLEPLGTLINSPGDTECLLNSDIGTGQFFEVKKNTFYTVPMDNGHKESISVKNHIIGNLEKVVTGGKIGLMVNSIEGKISLYDSVRIFNECVKQLSLCMHRS